MNRVIMIKYGELTTKKGNRNFFINTLYKNLKNKLKSYNILIHKEISRMYIEFDDNDLDEILKIINKIFGIHEYVVAYKVNTNIDDIKNVVLEVVSNKNFKTFKVETKRSYKDFPMHSLDFSKQIGGLILKNINNIRVDVHNPDLLLKIEIRDYHTYIYTDYYRGLGGYPNGSLDKGLLMLSGGIDSPVAGFLTLKRGVKLDVVYFEAIPHTSIEARNKVIELSKKLAEYTDNINLIVVPFTEIQEQIYKNVVDSYCITIMRRMMYRIMDALVKKFDAKIIVNGESIGQVASQTLTSMSVINNVTNIPVIRPVACLDKLEIIDIAKKIDTYDISILPYEDCCTVFVPKHPIINPNLAMCEKLEMNFDYDTLIEKTIKNIEIIKINIDNDNQKFKNLL